MAINFLIALATALGSATLILLVLRLFLKVFAPDAFKEMIAIPAKTTERRVSEAIRTPPQVIVDETAVSKVPTEETASHSDLSEEATTGSTEVSPPNEPTASKVSTEETASRLGLSEEATTGPTEISPPDELTASDLSTEETASHSVMRRTRIVSIAPQVKPANEAGQGLSEKATSRRVVALVQGLPLFMGLSPADCREILSTADVKQFARRQTIFLEGDPVRRVVLLTSGSAKVVQLGQGGTEVILGVRGPGEVVGTAGLRPQDRHRSTAQALTSSTALVWDAAAFETLSQRSEHLKNNITHILLQQLDELEIRYREISTEKTSVRLLHQLVRMANQIGRKVNESVEISLSREELAQLTGTTLFTVSRLLSEWNQRGIVSTRREAVRVNLANLEKLEREEKLEFESVTGPPPPQEDLQSAVLTAADLADEIEDLKVFSEKKLRAK